MNTTPDLPDALQRNAQEPSDAVSLRLFHPQAFQGDSKRAANNVERRPRPLRGTYLPPAKQAALFRIHA